MFVPLVLSAVAVGSVYVAATAPETVGDKAELGDFVSVGTAGMMAPVPDLPPDATGIIVRVENATSDAIHGPVVAYYGKTGNQKDLATPIGPIRIPKATVVAVVRKTAQGPKLIAP